MPQDNVPLVAFNRGIISKLALARTDIKRVVLSAETQTNWMPRVLGSMMLRPGWQYTGTTKSNAFGITIPFIFASDDVAEIQLTDEIMRVRVDETLITRASVSTAISNGDFNSGTNWTDGDESGATSTISGGILSLEGTGFSRAIRTQAVTVSGGDQGVEHALRVIVDVGPVTLRIGSTSGGDEVLPEVTIGTGVHSLAFTPSVGTIYVQFSAARLYAAQVSSCEIEAAGVMEIATPY